MWPEYRISADAESSLLDSNPEGQTISILLVHSKVDSKTKYWGAVLKLKLTTIGTSVGVILPKEASAGLKVDQDKGDSNFLTQERDGFRITPFDPQFGKTMESARKVMKRRRNVLRELAE